MSKRISQRINGFLRNLRKEESVSATDGVASVEPSSSDGPGGTVWKRLTRPFAHGDECSHTLSMNSVSTELPVEIWINIIWFCVEPQWGTNQYFRPQDLQFFYLALIIHYFSNPAFMEAKRTRASLRLVSRAFKQLVDEMKEKQKGFIPWLSSYSPDNATKYAPAARLDTQVHVLENLSSLKQPYPHEISIASIQQTFSSSPGERLVDLQSLLAKPWTLGVLHLSFICTGNDAEEFPLSILRELSSLHTLSIASHSPMSLRGKLELPWLRALFLTTDLVTSADFSEWKFRELQSLSIDSRGWPLSGNGYTLPDQYLPFMERHAGTIRSLRLIPMVIGNSQAARPILAVIQKMTNLEALATDLVRWSPISSWPTGEGLVQAMTGLTTLALTEDPFQDAELDSWGESKGAVKKLDAVCRSRRISIYGNMGAPMCCVQKAAKRLSNLRMEVVQEWYETSL
ncbi:hypothetical protein FRC17_000954 [Serendipita sp. 399]|nr:hypothetical protein FRC17_000954 [Serendipita sp. 399]